MTKKKITHLNADQAEKEIATSILDINAAIQRIRFLKSDYPKFKLGWNKSIGGVLNAYREGDLTFEEAIKEIEGMK